MIQDETLALAALFQACMQIQRCARTGSVDPNDAAAVIRALIVTNPRTSEDIYPHAALLSGYRQLSASLSSAAAEKTESTIEITKMAFKLISLEQAIEKNTAIFNKMGSDIDSLRTAILQRYPAFEQGDPVYVLSQDCLHDFSALYQSLISPNFPRLVVYGEEQYLRRQENQEMIRSLLLSGIRATVLWRQCGGKRRFFIFRRNAIVQEARARASAGTR